MTPQFVMRGLCHVCKRLQGTDLCQNCESEPLAHASSGGHTDLNSTPPLSQGADLCRAYSLAARGQAAVPRTRLARHGHNPPPQSAGKGCPWRLAFSSSSATGAPSPGKGASCWECLPWWPAATWSTFAAQQLHGRSSSSVGPHGPTSTVQPQASVATAAATAGW